MIDIALMLSEAGAGDYWDDIDSMVRNHLVEHQMLDRDRLEHIIANSPKFEINPQIHNTENVIERNIGAFTSCAEPTKMYAWWTMCCNANMMLAMHKAWDSIDSSRKNQSPLNSSIHSHRYHHRENEELRFQSHRNEMARILGTQ